MAPLRGKFPETAVRQREGGRAPVRRDVRGHLARLPVAAGAEGGLRRDDPAHGSRHRARCSTCCAARKIDRQTLIMFTSDNGPHQRRRRRPGFLQELGRPARHQARSLRRRHPRADDRAMDRNDPGGTCQLSRMGALGPPADADGDRRRENARGHRRHVDGARAARAAAADARVLLLGVPRARLPAGGADGQLEGGSSEAGTRRSSSTTFPTIRTSSRTSPPATRRRREDREVSRRRENGISALARQVSDCP